MRLGSWQRLAFVGFCWCLLCAQGCRKREHSSVIALIPRSTATDTSKQMHTGAFKEAARAGYRVNWTAPQSETDYPRQASLVLRAVEDHVAGIVLVPDHQLVLAASVRRARAAGVPVVIANAPIALPPEDYTAFVGSNDRQIGILAADRIGHLLGRVGEVGIVGVNPVLAGPSERERAFAERIGTQFPRITIVGTEYGLADWAPSSAAAHDLLMQHPRLGAIFADDGYGTMGTIAALHKRGPGRHIVLVGVDQEIYVLDALRKGTVDGVIATNWEALGEISMRVLVAALAGRPFAKHTELPVEMITRDNVEQPWIRPYLVPQVMEPTEDP